METYEHIPNKLKQHIPFRGNTMSAVVTDTAYVVYSYNLCIAIWYFGDDGESPETGKFRVKGDFTQTTRRHQNLVKKAWAA